MVFFDGHAYVGVNGNCRIPCVLDLTEQKYDMSYTWGIGTHSNKQGGRDHARNSPTALACFSDEGRSERCD